MPPPDARRAGRPADRYRRSCWHGPRRGGECARGGRLDRDHLAQALAHAWASEPHRRYGAGAATLLARIHRGDRWTEVAGAQFGGAGSWGNGAAMRTIPVALVAAEPEHAAHLARQQAAVSHTHPLAVDGAALIAVAANLSLLGQWSATAPLEVLVATCTTPEMRDAIHRIGALPDESSPAEIAAHLGTPTACRLDPVRPAAAAR